MTDRERELLRQLVSAKLHIEELQAEIEAKDKLVAKYRARGQSNTELRAQLHHAQSQLAKLATPLKKYYSPEKPMILSLEEWVDFLRSIGAISE